MHPFLYSISVPSVCLCHLTSTIRYTVWPDGFYSYPLSFVITVLGSFLFGFTLIFRSLPRLPSTEQHPASQSAPNLSHRTYLIPELTDYLFLVS